MRDLVDADHQAILRFFATQAARHLARTGNLPPACVLVWMADERSELAGLHQFSTDEVIALMSDEDGKRRLAHAIRGLLNSDATASGQRPPHAIVQVLLTVMDGAEALLLLLYLKDEAFAIALPAASPGEVAVPVSFDLDAARFNLD